MKDWLGTTKIDFGLLGKTGKVTNFEGNEVSYGWNELGQRTSLTYPDGKVVNYTYTSSGKLDKVYDGSDVTSYTYDPIGRTSERILPNGTSTQYSFYVLGSMEGLTHSNRKEVNHDEDDWKPNIYRHPVIISKSDL